MYSPINTDLISHKASFTDGSVWMLLLINVIALITAVLQGWSLVELMLIYWAQSLIIGASYVARISNLDNYSTEGFKINGKRVKPNAATKRQTAFFFCIHYGGFHAVYLLFMLQETDDRGHVRSGFYILHLGFRRQPLVLIPLSQKNG